MSTLTINLDKKLKKRVQKIAKKEGFTLTALVAQFFKDYAKGKVVCGLHLKLKDEILESYQEALEEINEGKSSKSYKTAEELSSDIMNEYGIRDQIDEKV